MDTQIRWLWVAFLLLTAAFAAAAIGVVVGWLGGTPKEALLAGCSVFGGVTATGLAIAAFVHAR